MARLAELLNYIKGVLIDLVGGDPVLVRFINFWLHETNETQLDILNLLSLSDPLQISQVEEVSFY